MKKLPFYSCLVLALVLSGCGEKDVKYYFNHSDELVPILKACASKVESAKTTEEVDKLKDDKQCKMAYKAKSAIELGSIEKANLQEVGNTIWDKVLNRRIYNIKRWAAYEEDMKHTIKLKSK